MLRAFFIYLSKAAWARHIVTRWAFAWRAASRFVAGEKLEDAIRAVRALNDKGINATLDHLGENTTNADEARQATHAITEIIDAIDASGVRSNVSIKLSQIGMKVDKGLCAENLRIILARASEKGNFIRIDMEDAPTVDYTLELFRKMKSEHGFTNCGVVIQAYLYRSNKDVCSLLGDLSKIRLCKGAYKEPSDVAFPLKKDVDANYDKLVEMMIDAVIDSASSTISEDGKFPPLPAIATHDPKRIENAKSYARKVGLPKTSMEFQMLYGIRRDLQEQCVMEGYPVRVYVPYGTEWYPYFVRRLAERPANVWFFISNFFRK